MTSYQLVEVFRTCILAEIQPGWQVLRQVRDTRPAWGTHPHVVPRAILSKEASPPRVLLQGTSVRENDMLAYHLTYLLAEAYEKQVE